MISGFISLKSIGLMIRKDINWLLKKFKLIFEVSRLLIIGTTFALFFLSGIPLIINSSYKLVLTEILWVLLFTVSAYFCININISQSYFYIIYLYLKLKLRNANNSIRKSFEKNCKMTNWRMKNIRISLDSIISEINTLSKARTNFLP
jgi:hypothetical protein